MGLISLPSPELQARLQTLRLLGASPVVQLLVFETEDLTFDLFAMDVDKQEKPSLPLIRWVNTLDTQAQLESFVNELIRSNPDTLYVYEQTNKKRAFHWERATHQDQM